MNFSYPFIRRPVGTTLLAIGLFLVGLVAYRFLPLSALPEVDYPTVQVQTFYPGASPEVIAALSHAMEKVLTDPTVVARFADMGGDARYSTPDGLRDALAKQSQIWTPVIQKANIKLE